MEVVLKFFQGFINMGASTLLPFVIAILGIFFGMKIGRAIKAGLLVGIGFQGLVLAVNLLITSVTPAMQYYKDLGSGYDTLEIGFAALGAASWTTPFAVLVIPAIIIANLILVRLKVNKSIKRRYLELHAFLSTRCFSICVNKECSYRIYRSICLWYGSFILRTVDCKTMAGILRT